MRTARELLSFNLKRLREAAEWDQHELADEAKLSHQMIQKIEQGKTSPSLETLDKIVKGFETHHAELFFDETAVDKNTIKTVGEMPLADFKASIGPALTPKESELLRLFRIADDKGKGAIFIAAESAERAAVGSSKPRSGKGVV